MAALKGLVKTARGWLAYGLVKAAMVLLGEEPQTSYEDRSSSEEPGKAPEQSVTISQKGYDMISRPQHHRPSAPKGPVPLKGSVAERVAAARQGGHR